MLELLDPRRGYDKVVFVTTDNGFLAESGNGFHPDILEDLRQRGIDRSCLVNVKNPWNAATLVESIVKATTEAAEVARFATVATDALLALQAASMSLQMVYGGDYVYPDFVKFSVPPLEDATIDEIEQLSEFVLSKNGDTVRATAEARVSLEGFMSKSDWFMDDGEGAVIIDDWNDQYFHAASEVTVTVIVKIDVSGQDPVIPDVALND